jgi:hypothetical protein
MSRIVAEIILFIWKILWLVLIFGLSIILFVRPAVRSFREKKYRKATAIIVLAVVVFSVASTRYYNYRVSMLPNGNTVSKEYIIKSNIVKKTDSGTKVKLNRVLVDMNRASFNIGVKGKHKLVAVEVKKSLEDIEPLMAVRGQWIGNRLNYQYGGFGVGYPGTEFIAPIYMVCHFSSGEEVSFKIEDVKNVVDKVGIIEINETINEERIPIFVKSFTKGISYSAIEYESRASFHSIEASLIIEGNEYNDLPGGASSGGDGYWTGSFGGPPIGDKEAYLRIRIKNTEKEYTIKIQ